MAIVNLICGGNGKHKNVLTSLIDRSITEIEIPVGVTKIGDYAFYNSIITKVVIPEGITSIGAYAFKSTKLTGTVTIPEGVTRIEDNAFDTCTSISSIELPSSLVTLDRYCFFYTKKLESLVLPSKVSIIPIGMLNASAIKEFTALGHINSIGGEAFEGCTSCLKYDFTACTSVPTLLKTSAFKNINADCKIYVPKSLYDEWIVATNWAQYADYIVGVRGKNEASEGLEINLLTDGSGYEVAGIGLCSDHDVIIPSEYEGLPVTHIRDNAFDGCSWLTSITIPNSVRLIYFRAFADCTGLTSIFIPGSVTWIDFYAFTGCSSITLYDFSTHEEPPTIDSYTFDILAEGVKIKVPKGKLAEWQSATNWCEYASYMVEAE